jgi:hypothetical protein
MKKKTVRERIQSISFYDLEGSIENVIQYFQNLKGSTETEKYYSHYTSFALEIQPKEYGDGDELCLMGIREETDAEFKKWQKQESQQRDWRRKQYESLKKEFEGK